MKGKFGAVTQVSLALLLALSLGFVTAGPSMAQEPPQEAISISPEEAEYNLDEPRFISTRITWADAREKSGIKAVSDSEGHLTPGRDHDYIVLGKTLLILNHYLNDKLAEEGKSVELDIQFDVGLNATFTITAIRTHPTIDPEDAYYDLARARSDDPEISADVKTTITWREAKKVVSIFANDGHPLQEVRDYTIEVIVFSTTALLTILSDPYLAGKLQQAGDNPDNVVLTIEFNFGDDATFNITAIEEPPFIDLDEAEYDLDDRADVSTTIEWGSSANKVESIVDGDAYELRENDDYTVEDIGGRKATLTVKDSYLRDKLTDIGKKVVLTIEFDVGDPAEFSITATGTDPTIDPEDAIYDLLDKAAVTTTITWRKAKDVVSIEDDEGHLLGENDYSVTLIDEETATLTILHDPYLESRFEDSRRKSVELTIKFDVDDPTFTRTFTITAVDAHPTIDPTEEKYDLNHPTDVTTTITWQHPTEVVSIVRGEYDALVEDAHYRVEDNNDGTATLKIRHLPYLRFKIEKIIDTVELTVAFNVGDDRTFTITAVRYPSIDPDREVYSWDDPPDFVETGITWGVARDIDPEITDNKGYVLTKGEHGDYIVLGNTLVILNKYLRDKLSDLDPVTLTIDFRDGSSCKFVIRPDGTSATISPPYAPYARYASHDVATTITWGSATDVLSIVDDDEDQLASDAYNVTRIYGDDGGDTGTATLTILHDPYLESRFEDSARKSVELTIDFDVGDDRTFAIRTGCFIATAAYGTPMAEEIGILREFRDGYLLTNAVGQALVDFYYRTSPPIAEFIDEHPTLKPVVRAGLMPAVAMSTVVVNTTPAEKMTVAGLLVLVSVALAVWTARRRRRGPQYS